MLWVPHHQIIIPAFCSSSAQCIFSSSSSCGARRTKDNSMGREASRLWSSFGSHQTLMTTSYNKTMLWIPWMWISHWFHTDFTLICLSNSKAKKLLGAMDESLLVAGHAQKIFDGRLQVLEDDRWLVRRQCMVETNGKYGSSKTDAEKTMPKSATKI